MPTGVFGLPIEVADGVLMECLGLPAVQDVIEAGGVRQAEYSVAAMISSALTLYHGHLPTTDALTMA